jgi:hypothetical protein
MPETKIAAKLVAAMGEIDAVTKEGRNELQKYKYVRAADVANEVRKVLVKHKIAFTYSTGVHERWVVDRIDRNTGSVIGQMNYSNLEVHFTFTDAESGDSITLNGIGCGQDTGEKAVYKAMTGALKYALRMNFIIPDESDPENEKAEVHAEVERQKSNPAKTETPPKSNVLTTQLADSNRLEAEKRAASERNKLAEEQGAFSIDGDILTCVVKGIQNKKMGPSTKTPGKEFRSVTFNGRLANGANFASVFDTELFESLNAALDKECKLKIEIRDQYVNVKDVVWIKGVGEDAA